MSDDIAAQSSPVFTDGWSQLLVDPDIHEAGGEHANEGVDFARYWAISALVDRELAGDADYAILFEYLQDIAILDSTCSPTNAVLYQVKKKEPGKWSRADLCRREKTGDESPEAVPPKTKKNLKAASPFGKLYLCVERLCLHVPASGVFLSNAPIALRLPNHNAIPLYSKTCLSQIEQEDFEYIEKKIASELGVQPPLAKCTALLLEQTKVTPGAMRETIRGVVADYLDRQFPTVANVSGQLVERLLDSFSKRSGPKPTMCSLADIIKLKGFTRSNFTEIIKQVSSTLPFATRLDRIIDCLLKEGFPSRAVTKIGESAVRIQTQLVRDPATKEAVQWDDAVAAAHQTDPAGDYKAAVTYVATELRKTSGNTSIVELSETDLHAIAILAIMYVEEQPTAPGAQYQN